MDQVYLNFIISEQILQTKNENNEKGIYKEEKISVVTAEGKTNEEKSNVVIFDSNLAFLIYDLLKEDAVKIEYIRGGEDNKQSIKESFAIFFECDLPKLLKYLLEHKKKHIAITSEIYCKLKNLEEFHNLHSEFTFFVFDMPLVSMKNENECLNISSAKMFNMLNEFYELLTNNYSEEKMTLFTKYFYDWVKTPKKLNEAKEESKFLSDIAERILENYQQKKSSDVYELNKGVFRLKKKMEMIVIGDLHGDIKSLLNILEYENVLQRLIKKEVILVFLGDYIDRGKAQSQLLRGVLALQLIFWGSVFLLKGNHELIESVDNLNQFQSAEGKNEEGTFVWEWNHLGEESPLGKLKELMSKMPILLVDMTRGIIFVHGGVAPWKNVDKDTDENRKLMFSYFNTLEALSEPIEFQCRVFNTEKSVFSKPECLLWARENDTSPNKRYNPAYGLSYEYGKLQVVAFLEKIGCNLIINGHDAYLRGYKLCFDNKLISIHSTGGVNNPWSAYQTDVKAASYCLLKDNDVIIKSIVSPNTYEIPDKSMIVLIRTLEKPKPQIDISKKNI